MKKYYIVRGRFGNEYSLYWMEGNEKAPAEFERISRKEAERLCRAERQRRKYDPAFSGFADAYIYPAPPCKEHENPEKYWDYRERINYAQHQATGYIVEA